MQTKLIDTVLEVCDVLMRIECLACLFGYTIADSKLVACPEVAVVGEVGILDDSKEACIAGVFLSADSTETIFEVVVGNDYFVVVGVGHARRVNRAVAKHLAFRINLSVPIRERQGLVVNFAAIIKVLEPSNCALVAVKLVAKCAVHNLVVADECDLLFNLACAVVIGEMTVSDASEVEILALAITLYLTATPTVVNGSFAATSTPSNEGTCIAATFDGTSAEAVLDEERRLAACIATEDACCLHACCIYITHVAKVAKCDVACHLVSAAN